MMLVNQYDNRLKKSLNIYNGEILKSLPKNYVILL